MYTKKKRFAVEGKSKIRTFSAGTVKTDARGKSWIQPPDVAYARSDGKRILQTDSANTFIFQPEELAGASAAFFHSKMKNYLFLKNVEKVF